MAISAISFRNAIQLMSYLLLVVFLTDCKSTSHETISWKPFIPPAVQGKILQSQVSFKRIVAADWQADLSGLIDLDDKKAKQAQLKDLKEPIQIYFYLIEHPKKGLFLIDTGVEHGLKDAGHQDHVGFVVKLGMNLDLLKVRVSTKEWLKRYNKPVAGVFLTHLHIDHILGLPDLPKNISIYVGPGEVSGSTSLWNSVVHMTTNALLKDHQALQELAILPYQGLDFFNDGSLIIYAIPGHTQGSLAFLVNATDGKHLVTGDTCHTAWGWEHAVSPGYFTEDKKRNKQSLDFLKRLADGDKNIKVHLGHQSF